MSTVEPGNSFGEDAMKHVCDMLKVNTTLALLNLSGESIVFFFFFFFCATISFFHVYKDNGMNLAGATHIAQALIVNTTLIVLSLSGE